MKDLSIFGLIWQRAPTSSRYYITQLAANLAANVANNNQNENKLGQGN